jgi:phosphate transport system permease protein
VSSERVRPLADPPEQSVLPPTGAGDRRRSLRLVRERTTASLIWLVSLIIPLLTVTVVVALYWRARPILTKFPLRDLLTGSDWQPMAGHFGFKPFIAGTVWVTVLGMVLATPICLLTSIYLSEFAPPRVRAILRPIIDILAGVPSVVYGLFGVLVIVPLVADHLAPWAAKHLSAIPVLASPEFSTGYTILAGGLVLGLMVIPFIVAVAEEVLHGVPAAMREASLALGATRWETVKHVLVRAALPGLVASVVLGFSRAFGETMAVLMVVGNVWEMPHSIFDPAYPLPALIANNYGEMMSIPLYDAALLLAALILLVIVLVFNMLAQLILVMARKRASA